MKSKRWIKLYTGLLVLVLVTMCMLWHLHTRALPTTRDYPEIQKEGVLRLVTEYNQSGYYIAGDTIEGFQYELSQAISKISGLEIQTHLEMNLTESFEALEKGQYDVIARNIPITSDVPRPMTAKSLSEINWSWGERRSIFLKIRQPYSASAIWNMKSVIPSTSSRNLAMQTNNWRYWLPKGTSTMPCATNKSPSSPKSNSPNSI